MRIYDIMILFIKNCYHLAPSSSSHLLQNISYIYLILKLKRDLELTGFVLVLGATMRSLMKNFGAREEDLVLLESGEVHHRVARDLQPAMRHRQIAWHRMLLDRTNNDISEAKTHGCSHIPMGNIASSSEEGSKINFKRQSNKMHQI